MIRRINFTGRRRIAGQRVRIRVRQDGEDRCFDAEIDLDGLDLPGDAAVYVEAYHRSAYRRFDFGTVRRLRAPSERTLAGIEVRNPLFRLKVVLRRGDAGRILAAADRVIPEPGEAEDEGRHSLLPVEYGDLGDRVWALDLDADWPRLYLNERIDGIREAARSGREFVTLVYPEVLRAVLTRILSDGNADPDLDDDDWRTLWLRFACRELGRPRPPGDEYSDDARAWVDEAVDSFCARMDARGTFSAMLADQNG